MSRSREFDPREALDKAMYVFWKKGYMNTSIEDLVEATGVSRFGLYGEFGNKHGLFLATLDHYQDTAINSVFGIVEQPGAGMKEIRQYIARLLKIYAEPIGKFGCLVCNTATEMAQHDKKIERKVQSALSRMTSGFEHALSNAQKRGEIDRKTNIPQAANYLSSVLLGASVMAKAGASVQTITDTINMALSRL